MSVSGGSSFGAPNRDMCEVVVSRSESRASAVRGPWVRGLGGEGVKVFSVERIRGSKWQSLKR